MEREPLRRPMMFKRFASSASYPGAALAMPSKLSFDPTQRPLPLNCNPPSSVMSLNSLPPKSAQRQVTDSAGECEGCRGRGMV